MRDRRFHAVYCLAGLMAVMLALAWKEYRRQSQPGRGLPPDIVVAQPEPVSRSFVARFEARNHVVDRLLLGEIRLIEAASLFRNIDPQLGGVPGASAEVVCRQVIDWASARVEAEQQSDGEDPRIAALETELQTLLAAGVIDLP
ncbi:MAG: hypothetical protein U0840_27350 [Gemmataceae bacterium]